MKGRSTRNVAAPVRNARPSLISLPQEVLEMIVNHLHGNDKSHLAVCCKATLPFLCMGHVRVTTDKQQFERPLLQATRCLTKQPGGVLHFELSSRDIFSGTLCLDTCHLVGLSLFFNLRKLTLHSVPVFLPALQPVATQVHELNVYGSRLHGSADRFLTKGWAALTSLSLAHTHMDHATIIAALELPMLEDTYICWVTGHRGGALQLDQLTGSCPHVSRMDFQLGEGCWQATKARRHSCSLLNLKRLADLQVMSWSLQANVDLDLHPSLTQLRFQGYQSGGNNSVDFLWALLEAVKCAGRGAQLHKLICKCAEAHLRPAQWGASLDEQHRRLGGQLSSLRELVILSACEQPLRAVGAVASAAASPTRLEIIVQNHSLPCVEVSPICSASLESIRVEWDLTSLPKQPPQLLLTLLPGCTRLQEVVVVVRNMGRPIEGAAVKIRCHCCSQRCIVPAMGYASFYSKEPKKMKAGAATDVIVRFVHMPPSEQGVQDCTLLYACHAAGPKQAPLWGCDLMPGIL